MISVEVEKAAQTEQIPDIQLVYFGSHIVESHREFETFARHTSRIARIVEIKEAHIESVLGFMPELFGCEAGKYPEPVIEDLRVYIEQNKDFLYCSLIPPRLH